MVQRTLELYYDQLVIGSDLSALAYSYTNSCPMVFLTVDKPYKYSENENWEEETTLWNDLAYLMSNDRYIPFSDKIVSIRLENDKQLKIVTKFGLVVTVSFEKLVIVNDKNIEGLPPPTSKTNNLNWVLDWINVKNGSKHEFDSILDDDEFIKKIYFYKTLRGYKIKDRKDIVAVSKLSDEQLKSSDYEENIARLKVLSLMKKNGIKGSWDKTNNRYVLPKIESVKRDIYPLGKNIYEGLPQNISILYDDYKKILLESDRNCDRWLDLILKRYEFNK